MSEAWLVHHHCFLSCIQNKDGFLTSEKDFKTLILLFGDETAAHPEVYNALPHSLLLQCSVQCICGQGETGSVILKYNRRKYFLQSSATDKKKAHRQDFLGKKENTAEDVAVLIDMDWGENASWILQAALLLFHINLKQEGMPKKEV